MPPWYCPRASRLRHAPAGGYLHQSSSRTRKRSPWCSNSKKAGGLWGVGRTTTSPGWPETSARDSPTTNCAAAARAGSKSAGKTAKVALRPDGRLPLYALCLHAPAPPLLRTIPQSRYRETMKSPQRSALVDLVMPEASEEERAEATRRWFGFLQTLVRIVEDRERTLGDSHESEGDDRFGT